MNQDYNISEDPEKIEDSLDNFPATANFEDGQVPVDVVSLKDILLSMKTNSRFVKMTGPSLTV